MNARQQIGAAATGLVLIWGAAQAGPDAVHGAPAQSQPRVAAQVPDGAGASGNDVIVLEVAPTQGASEEEVAAMQMLLLQLLMMQQEMGDGQSQIAPRSSAGIEI
ncbi:MAG: hypothetical protein QOK44_1490 [Betaproteobacteria bacterium]|jgi:hypothetical protein|nr:hypothetical protein [Betaproteobacteria bacterium]